MKKILYILPILLVSLFLMSCDDKENLFPNTDDATDVVATITEETLEENILHLVVEIDLRLESVDEVLEVINRVVSEVYLDYIEDFQTNKYTITIDVDLKDSAEEFAYGSIIFTVNKTVLNPGLTLENNNLKLPN